MPADDDILRADPEQQRIAAMLRAVDSPAPTHLRREVEEMVAARRGPTSRRPLLAAAGALGTAAVALLLVLVVLPAGGGVPSVTDAASISLQAPTSAAPAVSAADPEFLDRSVGTVSFPTWTEYSWRATGARTDERSGRRLETVAYADADGRWHLSYLIASGEPLPGATGAVVRRSGVGFRVFDHDGAHVVTWTQGGHTCVLASRDTPSRTLVDLAAAEVRNAAA